MIILDESDRREVLLALLARCREMRRNGVRPSSSLMALVDHLAGVDIASGPERTNSVNSGYPGENECVNVSITVAAGRLGVSERTVRRMLADGRLASVRIRRRVLIPVAELGGVS